MKWYSALFICLFSLNVTAQNQYNKISINPVQLFGYNRLNLEYERGFKEGKWGIAFYIGQTGVASRKVHDQYSKLSEQSVSVKRYLRAGNKSSFWYGGMITVSSGEIHTADGSGLATNIGALGIQGICGYQLILKSFYATPYLGAGYSLTNDLFGSAKYTGEISQPGKGLLTYGLKAGICF